MTASTSTTTSLTSASTLIPRHSLLLTLMLLFLLHSHLCSLVCAQDNINETDYDVNGTDFNTTDFMMDDETTMWLDVNATAADSGDDGGSPFVCELATERVDCSGHGYCMESSMTCDCEKEYATHYSKKRDQDYPECNYKRKEQLVAFLLSFFTGIFGGGRWYVEDYVLAPVKMCILFAGFIISCVCCCCFGTMSALKGGYGQVSTGSDACLGVGMSTLASVLMCCTSLAAFAWWLADVILFGTNEIKDGNGVSLAPW